MIRQYVCALNTPDEPYPVSDGVFAVRTPDTCTIYTIIGSRIYHEHEIRQNIRHRYADKITADADYDTLREFLAGAYPGTHHDIFKHIEYDIHDMRVRVFINKMVGENGGEVAYDIMAASLNKTLDDAAARSEPDTLNVSYTPTRTCPPPAWRGACPRQQSPPLLLPAPKNALTEIPTLPFPTRGGAASVFVKQDRDMHNYNDRRQYTLMPVSKKTWPGADYTYAPIFYMMSDIPACMSALCNRKNSAMYQLCLRTRNKSLQNDSPAILTDAIADLTSILDDTETILATPTQKLNKIFAALHINIADSLYIIAEGQASPTDATDPSCVLVMSAYITDDTYTDVEHSLEYKGADCYTILSNDTHRYPKNACYMYMRVYIPDTHI